VVAQFADRVLVQVLWEKPNVAKQSLVSASLTGASTVMKQNLHLQKMAQLQFRMNGIALVAVFLQAEIRTIHLAR
jgi:hypothetical protein